MASPRSWACQGTRKGIQSGHVAGKSRSTATASVHSFIWQFPKGSSWRRKPGLTFHYQPCDHGQVTPLSPASISTSHPLKHSFPCLIVLPSSSRSSQHICPVGTDFSVCCPPRRAGTMSVLLLIIRRCSLVGPI